MKKWTVFIIALGLLVGCSDTETKEVESQQPVVVEKEDNEIAKLIENESGFYTTVEAYYNLPSDQRTSTYDKFMYNKEVVWEGTIADFLSDSVIVYGKPDGYNGEDWATMSNEKQNLLPYVFIAELNDKAQLEGLNKGDIVRVNGLIGSRGDKDLQYNWKLYESEIIK